MLFSILHHSNINVTTHYVKGTAANKHETESGGDFYDSYHDDVVKFSTVKSAIKIVMKIVWFQTSELLFSPSDTVRSGVMLINGCFASRKNEFIRAFWVSLRL